MIVRVSRKCGEKAAYERVGLHVPVLIGLVNVALWAQRRFFPASPRDLTAPAPAARGSKA